MQISGAVALPINLELDTCKNLISNFYIDISVRYGQ